MKMIRLYLQRSLKETPLNPIYLTKKAKEAKRDNLDRVITTRVNLRNEWKENSKTKP